MNRVIKMSCTWTALVFSCVLLAACGGGDGGSSSAVGSGDTASGNTGTGDTGSGDTGADDTDTGDTGSDDVGSGGTDTDDTGSGGSGSGGTGSGSDDVSGGDDAASGVDGSATLSWLAPDARVDGDQISPTDLVSYTIRYGKDSNNLDQSVVVDDISGQTTISFTIENLEAGTWYFSVQAQDRVGLVSEPSDVVSKTISS